MMTMTMMTKLHREEIHEVERGTQFVVQVDGERNLMRDRMGQPVCVSVVQSVVLRLTGQLPAALSQTQSLPGDPRTAVNRRYSVSSSEDNLDLEASLASLTQIPENGELRTPASLGRAASSSPKAARATISSIFNFVKPSGSVSSSMLVPETIWTAKTNYAYDTQVLFKRRIATLYSTFTSLRAYVELNYSGFRKILKKYKSSFMVQGVIDENYF